MSLSSKIEEFFKGVATSHPAEEAQRLVAELVAEVKSLEDRIFALDGKKETAPVADAPTVDNGADQ